MLHLVRIDVRVRAVDNLVRVPLLAVLWAPAPLRQILHVFTFEFFLRSEAAKETLLGPLFSLYFFLSRLKCCFWLFGTLILLFVNKITIYGNPLHVSHLKILPMRIQVAIDEKHALSGKFEADGNSAFATKLSAEAERQCI